MNLSRPRRSNINKKTICISLAVCAIAVNVFFNDLSSSLNLRSAPTRNLAILLDDNDASEKEPSFLGKMSPFSSSSYSSNKNTIRRTRQMEDGKQEVVLHFMPSYDILQTDVGVKLSVDVAGFDQNQLNAEIRNNEVLHFSGSKPSDEGDDIEEFDISFQLDSRHVDMKGISVFMEDGLMTTVAPMKQETQDEDVTQRLEIQEGAAPFNLFKNNEKEVNNKFASDSKEEKSLSDQEMIKNYSDSKKGKSYYQSKKDMETEFTSKESLSEKGGSYVSKEVMNNESVSKVSENEEEKEQENEEEKEQENEEEKEQENGEEKEQENEEE